MGVNPLKQKDELCTIAAIRLSQIIDLGKLDGHNGFEPTLNRSDLKWISEKYNISEFLVSGYDCLAEHIRSQETTYRWSVCMGLYLRPKWLWSGNCRLLKVFGYIG